MADYTEDRQPGDGTGRAEDVSFEASDAIPSVEDELEDEETGRQAINLDAQLDLSEAVAAATRPRKRRSAPAAAPAAAENGAQADAPVETADAPTVAVSSRELDDLKAELVDANDKYLRTLAEFQNYKRRTEEDIQRRIREGNEKLLLEILPVLDDFDLAVAASQQAESYEQLVGGVEATQRKFHSTLAKQGVEPIPAVGEKFDPDLHEAVMLDEDSDQPDETVTSELRKGYTLLGRVIRPSLVKVAKRG